MIKKKAKKEQLDGEQIYFKNVQVNKNGIIKGGSGSSKSKKKTYKIPRCERTVTGEHDFSMLPNRYILSSARMCSYCKLIDDRNI